MVSPDAGIFVCDPNSNEDDNDSTIILLLILYMNEPGMIVNTDTGKTFGPILKLATNGTIVSTGGG